MKIDLTAPEMAYIFGFLQTDGHLSKNTRNRGRLSIELKYEDKHILEKISKIFDVYTSIDYRTRDTNFKKNYKSAILNLFDQKVREQFIELGLPVGKKSTSIAPPKVEFSERDYFRGLIDGDGSVGFTSRGFPFVSFCTKSPYIANALLDYIYKVTGKKKTSNPNERDQMYNICVTKEDAQILAKELYNSASLALDRKKDAADAIQKWIRPSDMRKIHSKKWTKEEEYIALTNTIHDAMKILGRTKQSISMKKYRLNGKYISC